MNIARIKIEIEIQIHTYSHMRTQIHMLKKREIFKVSRRKYIRKFAERIQKHIMRLKKATL